MQFIFTQDQLLFQETVRTFLAKDCSAEQLRDLQDTSTGRSTDRWKQIGEMGLTGLLVPEAFGGMGFDEIDFVLMAEECGRAALPEPLIENAAVSVPFLAAIGESEVSKEWLPQLAAGQSQVAFGHPANPYVSDANQADLLLLANGDAVHAVRPADVSLTHQPSVDPLRKLYQVDWTPKEETCLISGEKARALIDASLDRGALFTAAECVGLAQQMVDMSVAYACERQQFGKAIGSYQAIKHHLASVQVKIEFARPVIYRAAHSVAGDLEDRDVHVSHAKLAATEAAEEAAKIAIQVHGAMGYTWEVDLHLWMKRAWALQGAWGDRSFHLARIRERVLGSNRPIGPGETF